MPQVTVQLSQADLYSIIRKEMELKFGRMVKSMVFNTTNPTEHKPSQFNNVDVQLGDEIKQKYGQWDR